MAYSETDRTYIRKYLGIGAIFLQAVPLVENALQATQSVADGGARPDSSTENSVKGLVYGVAAVTGTAGITPGPTAVSSTTLATPAIRGLLQVESQIAQMDIYLGTTSVRKGDVEADAARETFRLRAEGRRLCKQLARMLGMTGVISDVFSPSGGADRLADEASLFPASRNW